MRELEIFRERERGKNVFCFREKDGEDNKLKFNVTDENEKKDV